MMEKVRVKRSRDKVEFTLNLGHALALLRKNPIDWELADGNYELRDNEIIRTGDKGTARKPKVQKGD